MKRLVALAPVLVLVALVALFALFALNHNPEVRPDAMVGKPVPAVSLAHLAGGPATPLRGLSRGPMLINFYASWCAPCITENPTLLALKAEGVRIVGVAYKDRPEAAAGFLRRLGDPYSEVLADPDGRAGIEFGVTGVPETFLVDANGVIVAKHSGPLTPDVAEALLSRVR